MTKDTHSSLPALALALLLLASAVPVHADETVVIARLKYGGGGDWYSNPSSLPNLLEFISGRTGIVTPDEEAVVEPSSEELFAYPVVYMNGHGNVTFSREDVLNLRSYLTNGGFLFADDNYGMDKSFRREIEKVFPDKELVLLPKDHQVFRSVFPMNDGLPKIHEHDGEPAQAFGIFHEGRLVVFYSFQSDLGDGWEDGTVHNDPEALRNEALKMGANVIAYALTH